MNKVMHGIVLAVFAFACWSESIILKLPAMVGQGMNHPLPAFTRFCLGIGPSVAMAIVGVAVVYCLVVWFRKTEKCPSWVAFLATAMSSIVLLMLPMIIAIYLPIIDLLQRLPRN
jgi:hypothetical protein